VPISPPTPIPRKDLARGIDTYSAKGNIPDGYAQDLENVDTSASGQLSTRAGYEGYYGWLPLRVTKATQLDASTLKLEFADAQTIDLTTARTGPLVLAGRLSFGHTGSFGPYTNGATYSAWYDSFALTSAVAYAAGAGTVTQTSATHGFTDTNFWVGAAEITTPFTTSNASITPDDLQIDTTTFTVALSYNVPAATSGYLIYSNQTAVPGVRYNAPVATGTTKTVSSYTAATDRLTTATPHGLAVGDPVRLTGTGTPGTGLVLNTLYFVQSVPSSTTLTLTAAYGGTAIDVTGAGSGTTAIQLWGTQIPVLTHALNTFKIIARVYDTASVAGKRVETDPDDILIQTDGTVHCIPVDPTAGAAVTFTGAVYLEAVPATQAKSTTATVVGGGPTLNTFTLVAPGSPYLFFSVYRYNAVTSAFESVSVDTFTYDATTDTVSIDYYLSGASGELVDIYWTTGFTVANAITVTNTGTAGVDSAPALTVWGLDHAGIYRNAGAGGHVTHLDAYKRVGERRLVAGIGGNLYRALAYSEAAAWSVGTLVANLGQRVNADTQLGPLFWPSAPGAVRTRGTVYDASVVGNGALVTAATYVAPGVTDYTLGFVAKTGALTIGGTLATSDYLTVSGLANAEHLGSWAIQSIQSDSATQTVIRVAHPAARSSLNETGAQGRAAVATDQFVPRAATNWIPGDTFVGATVSAAGLALTVLSATASVVVLSGVTSTLQLAAGERVGVRRTTKAVPARLSNGTQATTGFVRGDMMALTGAGALARRPRVLAAQTQANQTATLVGTGTLVTVTVPSAHRLNVDDTAVLFGAVGGEFQVLTTPTATTFTYAGTTVAGTTTLQGLVLQLDEAVTVEDSPVGITALTVDGRWVPLEAPVPTYGLPSSAWYRYLDAGTVDAQAALRSTIIQDAMYFTNGSDEVLKFEGTYLTRAGLPRWQPGLFIGIDTSLATKIGVAAGLDYTSKSATGLYFVTATAAVAPGDYVFEGTANKTWLVDKVVTVPGIPTVGTTAGTADSFQITMVPGSDISGSSGIGTLFRVIAYKYYFKFNLLDRNRVIVASYAAQSEDFVVRHTTAGQLNLRLVGPPAFGAYDFDRVELEVYRTEADGKLFYLVSRQPVSFAQGDAYINVTDANSDAVLAPGSGPAHGAVNRDVVMTRLMGNELGTGWDQAPRAKCLTSLNNRLLLGNVKGYPETTLVFKPAADYPWVTAAYLLNLIVTLRRDQTSTATTTDMLNVARYEFVGTAVTITPATDLARTISTLVVTKVAHGLVAGNWVYLFQSAVTAGNFVRYSGWWQLASVTANTFTIATNSVVYAATATDCNRYVTATVPTDIPVWIGTDGNYSMRDGNAASFDWTIQAANRLAMAINATQRATTVAMGAAGWLSAFAGQDLGIGQIKIVSPVAGATTPGIQTSIPDSTIKLFVNGVDFSLPTPTAYSGQFVAKAFPARVVRSFANYPDVFDNPLATDAIASQSVIDVNPSDGQAITALIPFFGEAAGSTSASPLAQAVVVVKEQSVYLVDVESRSVSKIDTRGMGGTAPRAVCTTQRGIMFMNESGVYRLNRDMSVSSVGLLMSGKVRDHLNKTALGEAHAHHWAQGRRVKVSVPVDGAAYPNETWVYDYEREGKGQEFGAWTRHTAYPALGWANLGADAYWAGPSGDVFLVRARGEAADYRDEDGPVAEAVVTLRAEDFGVPNVRKLITAVTTSVELPLTDVSGLTIQTAQNLGRTFETEGGPVALASATYQQRTFKTSLAQRRGMYIQVRYRHQTKDQQLVLTGVAYTAATLSGKLVPEQAEQT
jgi:hypothetical protein